jgi:hypothetical protein
MHLLHKRNPCRKRWASTVALPQFGQYVFDGPTNCLTAADFCYSTSDLPLQGFLIAFSCTMSDSVDETLLSLVELLHALQRFLSGEFHPLLSFRHNLPLIDQFRVTVLPDKYTLPSPIHKTATTAAIPSAKSYRCAPHVRHLCAAAPSIHRRSIARKPALRARCRI